jgi:hypothetical protein
MYTLILKNETIEAQFNLFMINYGQNKPKIIL